MAGVPNLPPHTTTVVGSMEVGGEHVVRIDIRYWDGGAKRFGPWKHEAEVASKRRPFQLRLTGSRGYQGQEGDR